MLGIWILSSKKNVIIFQKENGNTFTLLIIFIVKSLKKEQNSTNLLEWPPICRNKPAITPKRFNSLDTNSKSWTWIWEFWDQISLCVFASSWCPQLSCVLKRNGTMYYTIKLATSYLYIRKAKYNYQKWLWFSQSGIIRDWIQQYFTFTCKHQYLIQ